MCRAGEPCYDRGAVEKYRGGTGKILEIEPDASSVEVTRHRWRERDLDGKSLARINDDREATGWRSHTELRPMARCHAYELYRVRAVVLDIHMTCRIEARENRTEVGMERTRTQRRCLRVKRCRRVVARREVAAHQQRRTVNAGGARCILNLNYEQRILFVRRQQRGNILNRELTVAYSICRDDKDVADRDGSCTRCLNDDVVRLCRHARHEQMTIEVTFRLRLHV